MAVHVASRLGNWSLDANAFIQRTGYGFLAPITPTMQLHKLHDEQLLSVELYNIVAIVKEVNIPAAVLLRIAKDQIWVEIADGYESNARFKNVNLADRFAPTAADNDHLIVNRNQPSSFLLINLRHVQRVVPGKAICCAHDIHWEGDESSAIVKKAFEDYRARGAPLCCGCALQYSVKA